jgi:hypothetical protein
VIIEDVLESFVTTVSAGDSGGQDNGDPAIQSVILYLHCPWTENTFNIVCFH